MSTEQVFITQGGPFTVPETYVLSQSETFRPSVINATFNGAGASGHFLPCCTIYSQTGKLISRTFPETVAAGDTAEVTYGPFLQPPSAAVGIPTPSGEGWGYYVAGSYAALILATSGLVAYWRMNTPTTLGQNDTSGAGTPANLVGVAGSGWQQTTDTPLVNDTTAASIELTATNPVSESNSTGAYWTVPTAGKMAISNYTYEAWIKPEALGGTYTDGNPTALAWAPLFYAFTPVFSGGPGGWFTALNLYSGTQGNNYLRWMLTGKSQQAAVALPAAFYASTPNLTTGTWYHVALTFDGTTSRLYLNGIYVGTCPVPSGSQVLTQLAGGLFTNPSDTGNFLRTFIGKVAEVAVYSRALTDAELLLHALTTGASRLVTEQAFDGSFLTAGTVGTDQLAAGAVTTPKIADSAVTTTQIADGTIIAADVSNTLKPSGGAGAGTEALRALGTSAANAAAGNDHRLGNPPTSGALPTVAPVSGTAFQVDTITDRELSVPITLTPTAGAAATCLVELSPDAVTYTTVGTLTVPAGAALDGIVDVLTVRVPQSWRVRLTATNATIGTGVYY